MDMLSSKAKYINIAGLLLFAASAMVGWGWWTHRQPLPSYGGRMLFEAMARGEVPAGLELECPKSPLVDCSAQSIQQLFGEYVKPRVSPFRVVSTRSFDFESGYGDTGFELAKPSGGVILLQLGCYATPSRLRASLYSVISGVSALDGGSSGIGSQLTMLRRANAATIRERGELAKYGIRGRLLPRNEVESWETWDRRFAEMEPKLVAEEQKPFGSR